MTPNLRSRWSGSALPALPLIVCLTVTAAIAVTLLRVVDLRPQVGETFFFSKEDPQVQADNEIVRAFPESPLILLRADGEIASTTYLENVRALSNGLAALPDVAGVQSLTRGPKDPEDASKSPLWSRLLLSRDRHSSFLLVSLDSANAGAMIPGLEALQRRFDKPGFRVTMSGVPYVTDLIARNLARDLRVFSLAAVAVFGVMLLLIFRSPWVLFGTLVACADSGAATLILTHLLRIPIGPLTANLSTMVFVMTLSPMVFLTFNRPTPAGPRHAMRRIAVREAVRRTVKASFWSGICMLLGFLSLLFVPSTPMRHLGVAGAIGAVTAFVAAYAVYPWFLERATLARSSTRQNAAESRLHAFFAARHGRLVAVLALFTLIGACGLLRLNTDPALPSYFKAGGDIRTGLEAVDASGGSSPLKLVVEDDHHAPLNTSKAYDRLWALQRALERDPEVGSVVSLAMVLGEAKRPFIAKLLSTSHLIRILDRPKYGEISRQLISADGSKTLLLLRMRESDRASPRDVVIARLKGVVAAHGFHTVQVGGAYNLLDQMAHLLTTSIISGVFLLIGIFGAMGFAYTRSLRVTAAMVVTLTMIPVVVRGYIAYLGLPLDFITASAANIDLGLGVDAMIYLTMAARASGRGRLDEWAPWSHACARLWQPIGTSLLVICSGFGIFLLSKFPPTQRFGLFVMVGSATAATAALLVFPWLAASPSVIARSARSLRQAVTSRAPS